MLNWKSKYLKYKLKYEKLIGGSIPIPKFISKYQDHLEVAKNNTEYQHDDPSIIKEIIHKYILSYYEGKKVDYMRLAKLLSTFDVLNEIGIRAVFFIVQQSEIICCRTFLNKETYSLKHTMLENIKADNEEEWNTLFAETHASRNASYPGFDKEKLETYKVPLADINQILLDRCMVRPFSTSVTKPHPNFRSFYNMIEEYFKLQKSKNILIDKMFFLNIYDHPVIRKDILHTNFLLSVDTITDIYSDIAIPHHDAWIFNSTLPDALTVNHYSVTAGIYLALMRNKNIRAIDTQRQYLFNMNKIRRRFNQNMFGEAANPQYLDIKLMEERSNKVVFRGSLTGCYQDDPSINKRLRFYNEVKSLTDDENIFDYEITGLHNIIQIENRLYDYSLTNDDDIVHVIFDGKLDPLKEQIFINNESTKPNIRTNYMQQHNTKAAGKFKDLYIRNDRLMFNYKYAINIDGYVSAWRLPYELIAGTVLFIVTSVSSWIYPYLKHGINCYIVNSIDEIIPFWESLEADEGKYYTISKNSHLLGKQLLDKYTILNSMNISMEKIPSLLSNEPFTHIY